MPAAPSSRVNSVRSPSLNLDTRGVRHGAQLVVRTGRQRSQSRFTPHWSSCRWTKAAATPRRQLCSLRPLNLPPRQTKNNMLCLPSTAEVDRNLRRGVMIRRNTRGVATMPPTARTAATSMSYAERQKQARSRHNTASASRTVPDTTRSTGGAEHAVVSVRAHVNSRPSPAAEEDARLKEDAAVQEKLPERKGYLWKWSTQSTRSKKSQPRRAARHLP